jgi:hypothetical protein
LCHLVLFVCSFVTLFFFFLLFSSVLCCS